MQPDPRKEIHRRTNEQFVAFWLEVACIVLGALLIEVLVHYGMHATTRTVFGAWTGAFFYTILQNKRPLFWWRLMYALLSATLGWMLFFLVIVH